MARGFRPWAMLVSLRSNAERSTQLQGNSRQPRLQTLSDLVKKLDTEIRRDSGRQSDTK
jgi:hypothetical protein